MLLHLALLGTVAAYSNDILMGGDVVFGGLFTIQDYDGISCGETARSSLQTYEAVRWFFKELNKRSYVQNISLGLHAFKTCGQAPLAMTATLNMMEIWRNDSRLIGLIGPVRSTETKSVSRLISSLPEEDRLPEVVYSATAITLSDKTIYKNLYRVIVPDGIQVEIISQLLQSLRWNYIGIVYEADAYGTEAAEALKEQARKHDICVPVFSAIRDITDPRRLFEKIGRQLEVNPESPVLGLVFIGQANTAELMFKYLDIQDLQKFQIIVSESILQSPDYLSDDSGIYQRAKGLLTSSPPRYDMELFQQHWTDIHSNATQMMDAIENNEWLLEYMKKETECPQISAQSVPQDCLARSAEKVKDDKMSIYVGYSLMAAAALAKTLKTLYEKSCQPPNTNCDINVMQNHATFRKEMDEITVNPTQEFTELLPFDLKFRFQGGEIRYEKTRNYSAYSIYNYQKCAAESPKFCYRKVGDYIDGQLSLMPDVIRSYTKTDLEIAGAVEVQCQPTYTCTTCNLESTDGKVIYIPGDFYVVGLVPIHNRGSNPYVCGELRTTISIDIAESITYAVQEINLKRDVFRNILGTKKIGLVLIDTCNTPFLTQERVIKFLRGDLKIDDNVSSSQLRDNVIGFIGPYASSNSVPLSSLMTQVNYLYISFASTSSRLSDRRSFPNFMRTCSPDSKQADVIMKIASALDSKYVQIIYTDEEYGVAGKDALEAAAKKYRVCIAQSLPIKDEATDSRVYTGFTTELRKFRYAKLVIIFVRAHVTGPLLKTLNGELKETGEFVFIGGENWGKRVAVLTNNDKLRGSLTLSQELPKNRGFEDYFRKIDIQTTENPWLQEYLELKYQCYYPMSFQKKIPKECSASLISETRETDTWVPFVINAVSSLVIGFNKTLTAKCFQNEICSEFTTADLINNVKDVRLDIYDVGSSVNVFDDNGEGIVGYIISHVIRDGQDLVYKKVANTESGEFSKADLDPENTIDYSTKCPNDVECETCSKQFGETTTQQSESTSSTSTTMGLAVPLGILVLIVIVLVVLLLVCKKMTKHPKDPDYLTVVPDSTTHTYHHGISELGQGATNLVTEAETKIV